MYNRRAGSQRSLLVSFAPSPRQVVTVHESSLLLVHTIVGKTCKRRPCLMADRVFPPFQASSSVFLFLFYSCSITPYSPLILYYCLSSIVTDYFEAAVRSK